MIRTNFFINWQESLRLVAAGMFEFACRQVQIWSPGGENLFHPQGFLESRNIRAWSCTASCPSNYHSSATRRSCGVHFSL